MKEYNVLSVFDGMSCGQIAFQRAKKKVKNYYASEIKKHAIMVTQKNFPNTKQVGDVRQVTVKKEDAIDILIGGSPCKELSIAIANKGGEKRTGLEGERSGLFYEFVRIYKQAKAVNSELLFLLENVKMTKENQDIISDLLGVQPIRINSNLVSFQNRDRYYWTNIPNVEVPSNLNISFQDHKSKNHEYLELFKVNKTPSREIMWGDGINGKCPNVTHRDKVNCLTVKQDRWSNSGLVEHGDFCRYLTTEELEKAQTVPVGYCDILTKNQAEDVLGDGWTIDVIAHILKNIP